MASLNTLRTRGGLIVSIVIGIALLAFLLGDLSSAGGMLNSRKMRVGEINGTNIDYLEYSNRVDYLTMIQQYMNGQEALSTEAQDRVREEAWESFVTQYGFASGFKSLGITVSEAEQIDMIDGVYVSPVVSMAFGNPYTGQYDPDVVRNFVANLSQDPTGRSSVVWNYLKDQMARQRNLMKCMNLLAKGMYVTDLEVETAVASINQSNDISYVVKEYFTISDSAVHVTDAEVREYYKEHKRLFKRSAYRDIEYVVFDVLPSEEDYAAADEHIRQLAAEFAGTDTPFQFAQMNSQTQPVRMYLREDQLTGPIAAFAYGPDSGTMYGPVLEADTYTLARVADSKLIPDSLGARHILLPEGEQLLADSLLRALRNGASFAELAAEYSIDEQANLQGGDLGIFPPEMMIPEFSEAAMAVNPGQFFLVETQFGIHVGELTLKSVPVRKVQIAEITYKVEPSEYTQQDIYSNVSNFMAQAAGSYENFKQAATDNALPKRAARVHEGERTVSGLDDPREAIRWAFNAKPNEVSSIMQIDNHYVVAALAASGENGYVPLKQIASEIATVIRQEKKGRMLTEQMSGIGSLPELATQMDTEVKQATGLDFNSFYVDGLGVEPAVIGASTVTAPGALSKPVIGNAGVYVLKLDAREERTTTTVESERARLQALSQNYIGERITQALVEKSNIKDNRNKFF